MQEYSQASERPNAKAEEDSEANRQIADETTNLAHYTWLLWVATAGIAVIAFFQLWMFYFQWRTMRATLDAAEENTHRQLRAYVFVKEIKIERIAPQTMDDLPKVRIVVQLRNTGQTAARHLVTCTSLGEYSEYPNGIPEGYEFPDMEPPDHMFIAPNDYIEGTAFTVEHDTMQRVANGESSAYIWGWADYDDVFKGTPRHTTEFYYRINFRLDAANPIQQRLTIEPVPGRPVAADDDAKRKVKGI